LIPLAATGVLLWAGPIAALSAWYGFHSMPVEMAWFFTQAALLTFGGAYAVLPFVTTNSLARGWLLPGQMIDGLALGETTPGPLIMVVSFVGFVGGWQSAAHGNLAAGIVCCLVATYFTFLPSFLFILSGGPFVEARRGEVRWAAALGGIAAAIVGVMFHLAVFFAVRVFWPAARAVPPIALPDAESAYPPLVPARFTPDQLDWFSIALAATALVTLWRFQQSIVRVVLACGAIGLLRALMTG
jgi:chromate transporter